MDEGRYGRRGERQSRQTGHRTPVEWNAGQPFRSSMVFATALAFAACLPTLASACQISVTGPQGSISNSTPVDCISISDASVAGGVNNTGSILLNGIAVTNSSINDVISNIGSLAGGNITTFAGGIVADDKSSITGGVVGIGLIGIPSFSGGINNGATITAGTVY
jgi:hypothetical protein